VQDGVSSLDTAARPPTKDDDSSTKTKRLVTSSSVRFKQLTYPLPQPITISPWQPYKENFTRKFPEYPLPSGNDLREPEFTNVSEVQIFFMLIIVVCILNFGLYRDEFRNMKTLLL
jgi:hypothetical protein